MSRPIDSTGSMVSEIMMARYRILLGHLESREMIGVAFSGGVDSTFLLAAAVSTGKSAVIAVTAESRFLARKELEIATATAARLGVTHLIVPIRPLDNPDIARNQPDRCYHCKRTTYKACLEALRGLSCQVLMDGAVTDDAFDFRPGAAAARELGVLSPLADAGLGKEDVRTLSRDVLKLEGWDRNSGACLASRFPPGTVIRAEDLMMVEAVEQEMQELGLDVIRARHFGRTVRLETSPAGLDLLSSEQMRKKCVDAGRRAGFEAVTLDLEPYRTGRMNQENL